MRPDLQGLKISPGELRRLSGVSFNDVLTPPTLGKFSAEIFKTLLIGFLLVLSYLVLSNLAPTYRFILMGIHGIAAILILLEDWLKIRFTHKNKILVNLLEDVERFNGIIQAIDINDQIEAAGNPEVSLENRQNVIEALELAREDLVRALKTERILRKNQYFIARNPELFANNLTALAALQVSDRASEQGKLLNEALQIALNVQTEMRKLNHPH